MSPPPSPGSGPADCVVVGGGVVGTALAYELACRGATTVLVDRHDRGRATDAGAGILSPETNLDPESGAFAVGCAAARHYEELVARLAEDGVVDTGYGQPGSLLVAERPGDDEVMAEAVRLVRARAPRTEEVEPEEARRHFPLLGTVRRALFNPDGRRVDGRVLRAALEQAAQMHGVRIERASALGIDGDRSSGVVRAVRTDDGDIPTSAVAIAGGAWTSELAGAFGVTLPVRPLKGQIVHLGLPDADSSGWTIVQPVLGFYLVPWPGGRVACGGTMEPEAGFDHRVTADGVHQLLRECLRTAPGLAGAEVIDVRVGSRPVSADGLPLLGRVSGWSDVVVATGHGTEGLLLGPLSAGVAADLVLGRTAEPAGEESVARELARWSPGRFGP
ncbi:MAG TPA: FAD-dependent oxidoreductase [Acidimicrobiales bacterium]|nr:FAD-dependent oxidoreductase [Acidimicrobiales bacterium]